MQRLIHYLPPSETQHTPDDIPGRQHRAVGRHVLLAGPDYEGHVGVLLLQEQGAELREEAGVVWSFLEC